MRKSDGIHHAVRVYGTETCHDTLRTRTYLDRREVEYNYYDIEKDAGIARTALALAHGSQKIPVVDLGEGSVLVEPSDAELEAELHRTGHLI